MTTLKDLEVLSNGAHFHDADLHVHSFGGSPDVADPTMTPAALVDAAVKRGTRVLAITDHNSIKNTEVSIEHAQNYPGQILVLAGVEITTAHGHLLVYFAPAAVDSLQTFVARLEIVNAGTKESHTTKSMADVIAEAARLGGLCVAAHIDRKTGFESSAAGFPNWKKDVIASPGLVGLEFADPSNLAWYSASDASPESSERRKLLSHREQKLARRAPFAHVQNSDAHSLADFIASPAKRLLTRIKMNDLTFDGVKTAFADPEARVRAVAPLPRAIPRVLAMHVSGGFLRDEKYHFSDNLNGFIGGRGTGKSTAVRCIAYALGVDSSLEKFDNCPDSVVVYCRDASGVLYRYERMRGSEPIVKAKEDERITNVPVDSFRVEFYGQGALAVVARDPLENPELFQEFLDRHTRLGDLADRESELLAELEENSSQLLPAERLAATKPKKKAELTDVAAKLRLAEEGKLKDLVAAQTRVTAEKSLATAYRDVRDMYQKGLSLQSLARNVQSLEDTAGARTGEAPVEACFAATKMIVEEANAYARAEETAIRLKMKEFAKRIDAELERLAALHKAKDEELGKQTAALQAGGLTASIADLQRLLTRQGQLTTEISRIDQAAPALARLRDARRALLQSLDETREAITERRKTLIKELNSHLASAIDDYIVAIRLQPDGIIDDFVNFVLTRMRGTYLQEDIARTLCRRVPPKQLAEFVAVRDVAGLAAAATISTDWAEKLCNQLGALETRHALEVLWKTPRPEILVVPKGSNPKPIPVNQLSDGQRHTIFLTMALVADSDAPLIIDQPEDDLDNAFIFSSVVETLRHVKERRQVFVVTHNANIAVLGDAELLFPMRRTDDRGVAQDRGAIDRRETRDEVQRILEGGKEAFRRRKDIYGY